MKTTHSIYLYLLMAVIVLTSCGEQSPPNQRIENSTPSLTAESDIMLTNTLEPSLVPSLTPEYTLTATATLIPYQTPDWFRESILYEIFVRSFYDSNGDGIGDIQGIISKLDYIESLGMNTIWLMPIHPSPSVHGYDVTDYFSVNPEYGTMEDLQELVNEAHRRNMKVLIDFVPSHLSNQHPIFQEAYGNPASQYSDWFVWNNDDHTLYAGFANSEEMPRFNHYNQEVVSYLTEAALFWLDLDNDGDYTDGVDGFRVDNATFPPQEFLVQLRQAVKTANPQAVLLGETWVNSVSDMSRFFEDQFDALFDFPIYQVLQGDQNFNGDGVLAGRGFPILISTTLDEQEDRFPPEGIPVRFLSNHDTNRIASEVSSDPNRVRLAAAYLASMPDPVMLYYGEEIGMPGQKGGPPYWDNFRREPMDWYAGEYGDGQTRWFKPEDRWNKPADGVSVEEQEGDPGSLLNFYRSVLSLRQQLSALLVGEYQVLDLSVDGPGPWGILRFDQDQQLIALFNFSDEQRTITIEEFPFSTSSLVDLLTGDEYPGSEMGQPFTLTLMPSGVVWLMQK